jgi:hypothetical protein
VYCTGDSGPDIVWCFVTLNECLGAGVSRHIDDGRRHQERRGREVDPPPRAGPDRS